MKNGCEILDLVHAITGVTTVKPQHLTKHMSDWSESIFITRFIMRTLPKQNVYWFKIPTTVNDHKLITSSLLSRCLNGAATAPLCCPVWRTESGGDLSNTASPPQWAWKADVGRPRPPWVSLSALRTPWPDPTWRKNKAPDIRERNDEGVGFFFSQHMNNATD